MFTRSNRKAVAFLLVVFWPPLAFQSTEVRGQSPSTLAPAIEKTDVSISTLQPLKTDSIGRVVDRMEGNRLVQIRQWPGTYFRATFIGTSVAFSIGAGDVHLAISMDGDRIGQWFKPKAGVYQITGLTDQRHTVRVDIIHEDQGNPSQFNGFYLTGTSKPFPKPRRRRSAKQFEFIGDSWTVGYGNTSQGRECSGEDVWKTTDTAQGIAPRVSEAFGADYHVNAISGRGVVRNYGGGGGDTIPVIYPFALFDKSVRVPVSDKWQPSYVFICLGTNDFSTPLREGEKWGSQEELRQDYINRYVEFLGELRKRYPMTYFVLWANQNDPNVSGATQAVLEKTQSMGETDIGFAPIKGITLQGCHWHPNLADDQVIADALIKFVNGQRKRSGS